MQMPMTPFDWGDDLNDMQVNQNPTGDALVTVTDPGSLEKSVAPVGGGADYVNRPQPPASSLGILMDDQQMRDAGVHPDQSGAVPAYSVIDATGASSSGRPAQPQDGVLWGQLGRGALKATGGALTAGTGAGLCSSGLGCVAGAPMAAIGVSDGIQGGTMMRDAVHGKASQGYNPLRGMAESAIPNGGTAYDLLSLGVTGGSVFAKVPLIVDPAVTGINTTRSLFGVTVPRMDNSRSILGNVFDSNVTKAILGGTVIKKAYDVYDNRKGP